MKSKLLIIAFLIFAGCSTVPQSNEPTTLTPSELFPSVPEFRIESLTKENRKDFELSLKPPVRKIFDEANELTILTRTGTFSITDSHEKRRLLDSIYWDLANSFPLPKDFAAVACKETTPKVSATITDEDLLVWNYTIALSYNCGWIDVHAPKDNRSHSLHVINPLSQWTFQWLENKYH